MFVVKLPCINFPMRRVQYPETERMRALIDEYGGDPLFCKNHNEFIYCYIEALLRWLPLYQSGYLKPDVSASRPELIGWGAYLRFQAVLKTRLEEAFFWDVILEYVHRDYLEQVLGIRVMADGSISRGKYISPRKYHQTTYSMPSHRNGVNRDELQRHIGKVKELTGLPEIGKFSVFDRALWRAVTR
jgi:hypothetical protein